MHPHASLILAAGYEVETTDLVARMTGALPAGRISRVDDLIRALKQAGVWTRLDGLWVAAAHDSQARTLNWKGTSFTLPTAGTVFTADRGFTGRVDTGYAMAAGAAGQRGYMGFWSQDAPEITTIAGKGQMGGLTGGVTVNVLATENLGAADHLRFGIKTSGGVVVAAAPTGVGGAGYYAVNRSSDTAHEAYFGTNQSTSTSAEAGGSVNISLNGITNGTATTQRCAAGAVAAVSLTQAEHNALYAALAAYMTAVGA